MFTLSFKNCSEIRMGSPFNMADVELTGEYIPDLSRYSFQDIGLVNPAKDTVYLVQWETTNNEPGFIVWQIRERDRSISKSDRISGFCKDLQLDSTEKLRIIIYKVDTFEVETISFNFR